MIISDLSRDNQIDMTEYILFLNRMTNNAFNTVAYEDLDPVLGNNFVTLEKGKEYIDVTGSKPGQLRRIATIGLRDLPDPQGYEDYTIWC
jgi:hypothetical protein